MKGDMSAEQLERCLGNARQQAPPGSLWRHHQGNLCWISTVSLDEVTQQALVTYHGEGYCVVWTRTLESFLGKVFDPATRTTAQRYVRVLDKQETGSA